jgi:hypothetical protein
MSFVIVASVIGEQIRLGYYNGSALGQTGDFNLPTVEPASPNYQEVVLV